MDRVNIIKLLDPTSLPAYVIADQMTDMHRISSVVLCPFGLDGAVAQPIVDEFERNLRLHTDLDDAATRSRIAEQVRDLKAQAGFALHSIWNSVYKAHDYPYQIKLAQPLLVFNEDWLCNRDTEPIVPIVFSPAGESEEEPLFLMEGSAPCATAGHGLDALAAEFGVQAHRFESKGTQALVFW